MIPKEDPHEIYAARGFTHHEVADTVHDTHTKIVAAALEGDARSVDAHYASAARLHEKAEHI